MPIFIGMERAGCRALVRWTGGCGAPRPAARSAFTRTGAGIFDCRY